MRILITGSNGTLGQDLVKQGVREGHEVIATDRNTLDITDQTSIARSLEQYAPDVLINAAAYNFVDAVEDPSMYPIAEAVNVQGPTNLARAAAQQAIPFVHFSTDYVFDGTRPEGYIETDTPNPISAYGRTKALGEQGVIDAGGKGFVLRLSKIFGTPGLTDQSKPSFVHLMMRLASELPELTIVDEEVGCPSYTKDIAQATIDMLARGDAPGIYHVVNEGGGVTWYEFAKEIFQLSGVSTPFSPVAADAFAPRPAARPRFAALRNTKLPPLRSRREALAEFLKKEFTL